MAKAFPRQLAAGSGEGGAKRRKRSVPLRYHWFACSLQGERPLPSFGKNASVFTEIHLPLNRGLCPLGKALAPYKF